MTVMEMPMAKPLGEGDLAAAEVVAVGTDAEVHQEHGQHDHGVADQVAVVRIDFHEGNGGDHQQRGDQAGDQPRR
jgi:hypothetical protein